MKIWYPINGTFKRTLNGQTDYVLALAVLQNGNFASSSADRTIKILNPINGTLKGTINWHTTGVSAFTALQNGVLASGSADWTIIIRYTINGTLKRTLNGHTSGVLAKQSYKMVIGLAVQLMEHLKSGL